MCVALLFWCINDMYTCIYLHYTKVHYYVHMYMNHDHYGSPCVKKVGGVPDKLSVFPADER